MPSYWNGAYFVQNTARCRCGVCIEVNLQLENIDFAAGYTDIAAVIHDFIAEGFRNLGVALNLCSRCETSSPQALCDECGSCEPCCVCLSCSRCNVTNVDLWLCLCCNKCLNCCRCVECRRCGDRNPAARHCQYCNACTVCCECIFCATCNVRIVVQTIGCCNNCPMHCTCTPRHNQLLRSDRVDYIKINKQPHHIAHTKHHKVNPLNRLVATEIEVCGVRGPEPYKVYEACRKWGANIVSDASLPSGGFEINTAPASGDYWNAEIDAIVDALNEQDAWVNERAGLHLHTDMRDFKFYDMRRLILLYSKIENVLYSMVPETRRVSRYCVPCGTRLAKDLFTQNSANKMPKESKEKITENIYGVRGRAALDRKRARYDSSRYNALNIHSWFVRGTVECRLHPGTVNKNEILSWGDLWAGIVTTAYKMKEKELFALPADTYAQKLDVLKMCALTENASNYIETAIARNNPTRSLVPLSR